MITALIIAAVIIFNVIFSALAGRYLWHIDMTREGIYTLSDNCKELLGEAFESVSQRREEEGVSEPLKVTIKFCDMEDNIMEDTAQRYVLMTAKELADRFPEYIDIEFINIWENPTAVEKYKSSVISTINSSDVIIESGTEYRAYKNRDFYLINSGETTPWAYYGEKRFGSSILAVTQTESPVAGVLTGHGETFTDAELVYLLETAGYEVQLIDDLINTELPENCRTLVCYNPTADFLQADSISDLSELDKLRDFLEESNHSFMVFMSPSSPILPNLENFLAEWGIEYGRHTDESGNTYPCTIKDADNALTADGQTFIGQYMEAGLGASITKDMRATTNPRRVIFKNAMPILIPDQVDGADYDITNFLDEETGLSVSYGYKNLGSGQSREVFNIFTAANSSVLMANGMQVASAADNEYPYGLMAISRQFRATQEDNYGYAQADQSSYVLACGSTEYVTEKLIQSATYGNSEVLLHAFVQMGKESVPSSLELMPFADTTIDTLTVKRANAYTLSLTIIPPVIIFGIGIFVIVRRKYS